ncbi:hypothetical protein [Marinobacterium rhizophilum]|uniref:hypothetical protein n=1 Tax=Marinobacterium rhizophilum TaxID=420402 RepID=UPI00037858CF|nr:hypothetical protein [Marinobacterium rhizophilum]
MHGGDGESAKGRTAHRGADRQRYLQLMLDVASADLPPKDKLTDYCVSRLQTLSEAQPFMQDAHPMAQPHARTSTPIL